MPRVPEPSSRASRVQTRACPGAVAISSGSCAKAPERARERCRRNWTRAAGSGMASSQPGVPAVAASTPVRAAMRAFHTAATGSPSVP